MTIRVALIDDSALVRQQLGALVQRAGFELLFTAADPLFAWPKLRANWPDVLLLDVEMPRQDGISFLRELMAEHPLPVLMCSTLTGKGTETQLQALAAGAVGCITKPRIGLKQFFESDGRQVVEAIQQAALARPRAQRVAGPASVAQPVNPPAAHELPAAMAETTDRVIAVGASTGGVQAFETLLCSLPADLPAGILLVQHMPRGFTASMAARLKQLTAFDVREAVDGERLVTGRVLIAPGGLHMQLRRSGAQYQVEVRDGPLVGHHKPSADVMLRSVAQAAGRNAIGVLLTGMGEDGARGLLALRQAGAPNVAQDEASCVVYGMPRAAVLLGAAAEVLPLDGIGAALLRMLRAGA